MVRARGYTPGTRRATHERRNAGATRVGSRQRAVSGSPSPIKERDAGVTHVARTSCPIGVRSCALFARPGAPRRFPTCPTHRLRVSRLGVSCLELTSRRLDRRGATSSLDPRSRCAWSDALRTTDHQLPLRPHKAFRARPNSRSHGRRTSSGASATAKRRARRSRKPGARTSPKNRQSRSALTTRDVTCNVAASLGIALPCTTDPALATRRRTRGHFFGSCSERLVPPTRPLRAPLSTREDLCVRSWARRLNSSV